MSKKELSVYLQKQQEEVSQSMKGIIKKKNKGLICKAK